MRRAKRSDEACAAKFHRTNSANGNSQNSAYSAAANSADIGRVHSLDVKFKI